MNIQVKPGGKIRILRLEVEDGRYEGEEGTVEFIDRSDSSTARGTALPSSPKSTDSS